MRAGFDGEMRTRVYGMLLVARADHDELRSRLTKKFVAVSLLPATRYRAAGVPGAVVTSKAGRPAAAPAGGCQSHRPGAPAIKPPANVATNMPPPAATAIGASSLGDTPIASLHRRLNVEPLWTIRPRLVRITRRSSTPPAGWPGIHQSPVPSGGA